MMAVGDCFGEACLVPPGALPYGATPAGNAFMLAAFAALVPPVVYAALRYRTLPHTLLLLVALLVEVVGHVGKIFLVANPTSHAYSAVYLMGTHWGAVLVGSAANIVLPHVVVIYGDEFQLVSDPVYLNILFCILDIFTLAFQSVGIGFASTAKTPAEVSQGMSILLTGLSIQATSLLSFLGIYRYFRYKLSRRRYILDDRFSPTYLSRRFKYFMICVQVVISLLVVRTAVRIAIFANGLTSSFARSQVASLLLDDTLVLIAALILAAYPVGRSFGAAWAETSPITSSSDTPYQPSTLPLRLRRHRRNRSSRIINKRIISLPYTSPSTSPRIINKRIISLPYTSPSTSPRFSPGSAHVAGMTPGLPAHPSPRFSQQQSPPGSAAHPPLMSPRNYPVHQRVPYDASPTQDAPFLAASSQESPGLDSAMWMTMAVASPGLEQGRKKKMWAGSGSGAGQEGGQMVEGDALWN